MEFTFSKVAALKGGGVPKPKGLYVDVIQRRKFIDLIILTL